MKHAHSPTIRPKVLYKPIFLNSNATTGLPSFPRFLKHAHVVRKSEAIARMRTRRAIQVGKAKPKICIRHAAPNMTTTNITYFKFYPLPYNFRLTEYLGDIQEYQEKY